MGNTICSEILIGMTASEAEKYIKQHNVYYIKNDKKYKIKRIQAKEIEVECLYPLFAYYDDTKKENYRLKVITENFVITKILDIY